MMITAHYINRNIWRVMSIWRIIILFQDKISVISHIMILKRVTAPTYPFGQRTSSTSQQYYPRVYLDNKTATIYIRQVQNKLYISFMVGSVVF